MRIFTFFNSLTGNVIREAYSDTNNVKMQMLESNNKINSLICFISSITWKIFIRCSNYKINNNNIKSFMWDA